MHPTLTIAVKAARRAGNVINRGARDLDLLTVTAKGPKDYVSEVDRAAEAAIVETLHATYPGHAILAEEGTAQGANAAAEHLWIIDPLDGTTNFLHGFPQYCVSIALAHKNVVQQGVIFDPVRNDLFTATRGRGAFLNDRRIRVSRRQHLRDCLIGKSPAQRCFCPGDLFLRGAQIPPAHQRIHLADAWQQCGILSEREDDALLGPH